MTPIIIPTGIEPIEIWRAARLMVTQHGDLAVIACAMKADAMLENGDRDGQKVWMAIRRAAKSLLENGPPADISTGPAP